MGRGCEQVDDKGEGLDQADAVLDRFFDHLIEVVRRWLVRRSQPSEHPLLILLGRQSDEDPHKLVNHRKITSLLKMPVQCGNPLKGCHSMVLTS